MLSALFATAMALSSGPAQAVAITATHTDPAICYAEESLEIWVEVTGDDVSFAWEGSDELYDLGGSIDVYDEDGVYLTCPSCPPAQDGDLFWVDLVVTDSAGDTAQTEFELEVSCGSSSGKVDGGCMTSQAAGGLLFVLGLVGLRVKRRG